MNCTLAEQLLPLFAGGDLQPPEADNLRQHLEGCAHCRQLAEEFAANQSWLREFAAPEFDEAVFADLRASVRREIAQKESAERATAGRWFEWLLPQWNPRLAFAVAALILLAGLAVVVYRAKLPSREPTVADKGKQKDVPAPPSPTPRGEEQQNIAGGQSNPSYPKRPKQRRRQFAPEQRPRLIEPPANDLTAQLPNDPPTTVEPAINSDLTAVAPERPRDMLRIEFQTDDPNIRIIWFTPKPNKTEPNTK